MTTTHLFKGLFCALLCLCGSRVAAATGVTLDADLKAALPSGEFFLPAPPAVGSLVWLDDSTKYFQYKEMGHVFDQDKQAYWDSIWAKMNEQYYFALYRVGADSVMNAPFVSVSWTKASATKYNVSYTRNTTDFPAMNALELLCEQMKEDGTSGLWRTRPRPYYYFGDWYAGKKYAKDLTNASSYPSGHGYFAGLFGMAMLYIDPDHSLAIKNMIDEWLNCRLILGAHWNTDLSAGWQLGAITFAIAMNYDQFKNAVEAAKTELSTYRAAQLAPKRIPDDVTGEQTLEKAQTAIATTLAGWKADCDANPEKTMDIEISRTFFCDGFYNSLSLPFDIAEADWTDADKNPLAEGTLKRFVSAEVVDNILNITIESASSIEAGTPYLIKFPAGDNIVNPIFKGVRVAADIAGTTETEAMDCKGTFIPYQIPTGKESGHLILGANNALYWPAEDAEYLRGFRAFFQVNDTPAAAPIRHNMSTQLTERRTPTNDPSVPYTNLQTYKLIDDGQVFIIQEGIKYNMSGVVR
ncbi:MAG: hypothetical protein MJZ64_04770 [Paludibacteraceae bacterium]|nr:hypothetical protein [Paludibacteraceae bacterium]